MIRSNRGKFLCYLAVECNGMQFVFSSSSSAFARFDQRVVYKNDKVQRMVNHICGNHMDKVLLDEQYLFLSFFFHVLSFHSKYSCKNFLPCSVLISLHPKSKLLFLTLKMLHMSTPGCTAAFLTSSWSLQPATSPFLTALFVYWTHWAFCTSFTMPPCRSGTAFWLFQAKLSSSAAIKTFFKKSSHCCVGMWVKRLSSLDLMYRGIISTCNFWQPIPTAERRGDNTPDVMNEGVSVLSKLSLLRNWDNYKI